MTLTDKVRPRYLIVDTCIIQHSNSSDKSKAEVVISCLKNLQSENYQLAISEFTVYENLRNIFGKKAKIALQVLKNYEWKNVTYLVLKMASMLSGLYHQEKVDYMSDGDKIIAATALLETGYVLTENHRDFPHPFFITEKYLPIQYVSGRIHKTIGLALYKPQIPLIIHRIDELNKN